MSWQVAFVQGQKATSGHCICSQEKEARPCFDMSVSPISFSNTLAPWVATLGSTRSHVKRRRIIEQSSACFVLQKWVTSKVAPQGYSRLLQARFLGQPAITLRAGTWPGHLPSPGSAARRTRNNVCFPKQAGPALPTTSHLWGWLPLPTGLVDQSMPSCSQACPASMSQALTLRGFWCDRARCSALCPRTLGTFAKWQTRSLVNAFLSSHHFESNFCGCLLNRPRSVIYTPWWLIKIGRLAMEPSKRGDG